MSQVDEFVRENILAYPLLFTNRTDVLHHALCVIGNGFRWSEEGTVVSEDDEPAPKWSKERELERIEKDFKNMFVGSRPDIRSRIKQGMLEDLEADAKVVSEVETRIHIRRERGDFYPQTSYALLMNIPSNVTDDWREACEEMRELAVKDGWVFNGEVQI